VKKRKRHSPDGVITVDRYSKPASSQRFETEIKRSRFITTVIPVEGKPAALVALESVRKEYPDASHHCWAMIAGAPSDVYHQDQSDDGEPKGTAGKPMLNILSHSGLGNVLVVVTRYFGGIKLGTGGLVRAYSHAVSSALAQSVTVTTFIKQIIQIKLPYSQLSTFEHWLKSTDITIANKTFSDSVWLQLNVPISAVTPLEVEIAKLGGKLLT